MKLPKPEVKKEVQAEKPVSVAAETVQEVAIKKTTSKPLSKPGISSGFSINSFLTKDETVTVKDESLAVKTENLPQNHFTETDLQMEWNLFLKQIQFKASFIFNAIKGFKLIKIDEKNIQVLYPSDSAKVEFDKISGEFFNHFKRKVQNYTIEINYKRDFENLKVEVMTKRKIFEKLIEKNPLLKDLDDLMKFDLS
ncbi:MULTISPECIES: hypothetical protein [unclassified Chryseobacterium]|uniref:hypothetical protein n=1 Tax=unclassified Chryseobacterium TaxID=2593645 RepID=UPI00226AC7D5|nr:MULTISPECIES: hypothetical protein [unclassified Chryseobacterium]